MIFRSFIESLAFLPPKPASYEGDEFEWIDGKSGEKIPVLFIESEMNIGNVTILYSHGNAEDLGLDVDFFQLFCHRLKVHVASYDYAGYGPRAGDTKPSEAKSYKNIEAVYDWLVNVKNVPEENIILYGKSLGSGPTLHLASLKPKIRGVVLQSAFLSIVRVVLKTSPLDWFGDIFINQSKIESIRVPVLFLHGKLDEVVPFEHGQRLHQLYSKNGREINPIWFEFAGHNDIELSFSDQYFGGLEDFFVNIS